VPGAFEASAEFDHDALATSEDPWPVDLRLVREIHFRWFETTFPADAGQFRTQMVLNRKAPPSRSKRSFPPSNTLAVRVYDVHPFIDGNTRATWHLRNYLLMLDGLRPLVDLADVAGYERAWWDASAESHDELDEAVVAELSSQRPTR
jgi:hypothetical protein